jgi:FkbM family methyltransferase
MRLARLLCLLGIPLSVALEAPVFYYYEPKNNSFLTSTIPLPADARSLRPTFRTDPATEKFRSHSQKSRQDIMVLTFFNDKNDGFFVDLASNHWEQDSNTYVLEYFNNWKGICIEPNPAFLEGLLANRKCAIVTSPVGKTNGEIVKFRFHWNGGIGGIVGEEFDNHGDIPAIDKYVPATTLTNLLEQMNAPRTIEYLSLDVEGAEHYVLQGLDPNKYTFLVVSIERPKHHSHHLLSKYGYRFLYQMADFGECMYLHQSLWNYKELMQKYMQVDRVPEWLGAPRPYMVHPKWNESYDADSFVTEHNHH